MSKHNTMNETHEQTGIELVKAGHSLQFEGISGYTLLNAKSLLRMKIELSQFQHYP